MIFEIILGSYIAHSLFCKDAEPLIKFEPPHSTYNPWLQNLGTEQQPLTQEQKAILDALGDDEYVLC